MQVMMKDKKRFLVAGLALPSITGVAVYWWTGNAAFAVAMALIPAGWEVIRLYITYEVGVQKFFLTILGRRLKAASLPTVYHEGKVASVLVPLLNSILDDGGTLVIMAGDGFSICAPDYSWPNDLQDFLRKGCEVFQYATSPTDEADRVFKKIKGEWPKSFHYRKLAEPSNIKDVDAKRLLVGLATLHPTYAFNDKGEKMLWIERYHPPQSTTANGCEFYGPEDLSINPEPFIAFQEIIDRAWSVTKSVHADETQSLA